MIREITIVCQQGTKNYQIGQELESGTVSEITIKPILNGIPAFHYCGFNDVGKLLFSVESSAPCDVEYL